MDRIGGGVGARRHFLQEIGPQQIVAVVKVHPVATGSCQRALRANAGLGVRPARITVAPSDWGDLAVLSELASS